MMASKCTLFIVIPRCTGSETITPDQTGKLPVKGDTTSVSKDRVCCDANLN
jgi:hypothetical protein